MNNFIILLGIIAASIGCKHNDPQNNATDLPQWVKDNIAVFEKNNAKAEIDQMTYKGKTVFLVDPCVKCPDDLVTVYDRDKNILCEFGGIAGLNTCRDFNSNIKDKVVLWPVEKK